MLLLIAIAAPLNAQTAKRPAITGIAFARFYTTDPAGAQKFYGDTLGYKRLEVERRVGLSRKQFTMDRDIDLAAASEA